MTGVQTCALPIYGMQVAADTVEMPITLIDSQGTAHVQKKLVEAA